MILGSPCIGISHAKSHKSVIQTPAVNTQSSPLLVRAIGRWSLAALTVNSIIGSGVFGLPALVAGLVGTASPLAVLLAGAAMGVIISCFAEVASQFTEAGGPYLYARVAFGRLVGIQVGWMLWLVRLTAPAANADLFVTYLGEFWPHSTQPIPKLVILTLLIGLLALVNYLGVRQGTQISNIFTVAKLVPLAVVCFAGVFYLISAHRVIPATTSPANSASWFKAVLLLIFAYGGFEGALIPVGEAKDPRRDVTFALFAALLTCIVIYSVIQWMVVGVLPDSARSDRPLADVARVIMGHGGAVLIATGALVSVYGYLSANMLAVPRITFALADRGDFPALFAAVHRRYRTPHFSILVFALLTWLFALFGNFAWNVTLSAIARLFYYALVCAALPVLRKKQPGAAAFRLTGGPAFAVVGILICVVLLTRVDLSKSLVLVATVVAAVLNWLVVRRNGRMQTAAG